MNRVPSRTSIALRAVAVAVALVGVLLATPASAAAASVTCQYDAAKHKVTVNMTGQVGGKIIRTATGRIKVAGTWCGGAATVKNTDTIAVIGDANAQTLTLSLRNGGLKPGWTNEPGSSDEIEVSVGLAGGGFDRLVIEGTDAAEYLLFGRLGTQYASFGLINLNGGESSWDADVVLGDTEQVIVHALGGNDSIWANGSGGMGAPFNVRLMVYGDRGNEYVVGGDANDTFYLDEGDDFGAGGPGNDYIDVRDGVAGNDEIHGGPGTDTCDYDTGDSAIECEL